MTKRKSREIPGEGENSRRLSSTAAAAWVVSGAVSTLWTQALSVALVFATGVVIARRLGADGRGTVAVVIAAYSVLATICSLGVGRSVQYHIAQGAESAPVMTSMLIIYCVAIGILIGGLLALLRGPFSSLFLTGVEDASRLVIWGAPLASTVLLEQALSQVLVSADKVKVRNAIRLVEVLTTFVLVVIAVGFMDLGVRGALLSNVAGTGLGAALTMVHVMKVYGFSRAWTASVAGKMMRYGLKYHVSSLSGVIFKRTEYFFLSSLLGVASAGVYAVANSLVELLLIIPRAVIDVSITAFARTDRVSSGQLAASISRTLLPLLGGLAIVAASLSPAVIPLVYGDSFRSAVAPFMILLLTTILFVPGPLLLTYASSRHSVGAVAIVSLAGAGLNVVLTPILIGALGLNGNALASVISYTLLATGGLLLYRRTSGRSFHEVLVLRDHDLRNLLRLIRGRVVRQQSL